MKLLILSLAVLGLTISNCPLGQGAENCSNKCEKECGGRKQCEYIGGEMGKPIGCDDSCYKKCTYDCECEKVCSAVCETAEDSPSCEIDCPMTGECSHLKAQSNNEESDGSSDSDSDSEGAGEGGDAPAPAPSVILG
ncbi:uncharacterized protein LOC101863857 [Aplysia californica]|uniref:Uncharacterized protein LOC101863857 n=1 Tax=Aplysia californica TaxID=6500 RepID=A0ABM0JAC1_APLCA|nr:uncharacterized protein LOC101863857 [Aplysia californica]